ASVVIPELKAQQPVLSMTGQAQGPVNEAINYVNSSPLLNMAEGFTQGLQASGSGKLSLQLDIPLHDTAATRIKGAYALTNASLAGSGIPALTRINGKVDFTDSSLRAQNINAWVYGGPAQLSLATGKDKVHRITARGSITEAGLREAFGPGFADRLSGTTDWLSEISIQQQQVNVAIRSSLVGMASTLPPPLAKTAEEPLPVRLDKKQQSAKQDTISVNVGNLVNARFLRLERNGKL